MKRLLLIVAFTIICIQANASDVLRTCGSRTTSLANCSVAISDFWSCHNNPAGIASQKDIGIGFSYQNKFMLKELGYKNAGVLYPFKIGVITVTASQFGYNLYNENIIGLGLARNFGNKLRIGLKLDYLFFKIAEDYDNKSTATFELGIQYQINESLCLGAYVFNPINVKLKSINKDKIPIIMRLGFSYFVNKDYSEALKYFEICTSIDNTETGAECGYYSAVCLYNSNKYDEAEEKVFYVSDNYSSYLYWTARAFIVLSDVYVAKDNDFQAKETLKSVIENYPQDGENYNEVIEEAQNKLNIINKESNE